MQKSIQKSMQNCMQKHMQKCMQKSMQKCMQKSGYVTLAPGAKLFGRQRLLRNFIKYTVQVNCFICTTKKVVTLRFDVGHIFIMITFSPSSNI